MKYSSEYRTVDLGKKKTFFSFDTNITLVAFHVEFISLEKMERRYGYILAGVEAMA